ncbi:MAG TPA: adenylate/guanylate cyclase domain-containing protein [Verrucomicrobiae bacterium]|nr:adenylate/guanylate cyclase domain-containing protein [Verrucomicrobiae bacterium]
MFRKFLSAFKFKKHNRRFWVVTAICGGTALLFLMLGWTHNNLSSLVGLEAYTEDLRATYGTKTPIDPQLVLIGIDKPAYLDYSDDELKQDPTLRLLQTSFPWSRAVWADLITHLCDAGAKVVVLDLVFGGQGEGDEAMKAAMDKYRDHVVIGCNIHDVKTDRGISMTLDVPNPSVLESSSTLSPGFDERVGFVNIWPDPFDDVIRFARYRLEASQAGDLLPTGTVLESLEARALRKFGRPELIPPGSQPLRFRYTDWAGRGYPVISLGDVLAPRYWKHNFKDGEFFRGKIVLVGPTADIFQDAHKTPLPDKQAVIQGIRVDYNSVMHGPEIHLNMLGAALHRTFLTEASDYENSLIVVLAGLLATALSFLVHQPLRRLIAIIALMVLYSYASLWAWNHWNIVWGVANPLLVLALSGVLVLAFDYFSERFEKTRTRKTLERYVSKNVVKELLDNPATYFHTLEGVRKKVTILFSDVRGFTTLTEGADSAALVRQLNEYFAEMVKDVFSSQGTLDKFIGDAVMAVWGNIVTQGPEKDAQHAVSTALAMKRSLVKLNADWEKRGMIKLAFGIGINHGEAIVANMGSMEKMELTVIGDTVNTASRLEGLTKKFHVDLLLGPEMGRLVRDKFILRTVGLIQPKGKTVGVEVYTVMGERGTAADEKIEAWLAGYETAVKLYRAQKFMEGIEWFKRCLEDHADDYLSQMYIKECEELLKNPPDAHWNGVFVMTEK